MFVEVALKAADAESWTLRRLGSGRNAMTPPSPDTLKLELVMYVIAVLILVGSFLAFPYIYPEGFATRVAFGISPVVANGVPEPKSDWCCDDYRECDCFLGGHCRMTETTSRFEPTSSRLGAVDAMCDKN